MIRVGIGGWTYEPWRGTFYPPDLPKGRELEYASRNLTSIEVNGTFYRTQSPESFRRWAAETPDDFVFTLKGPRYVVQARKLAETAAGVERFVESGIAELGGKLGPILWQFAPTRRFDEDDCAAFLSLLPREAGGRELRHALEVRHESFREPRFVALARRFGAAIVYADSDEHPAIADATGPFVYARLQRTSEAEPEGYASAALDSWAARAKFWASGGDPPDLPHVDIPGAGMTAGSARPVFVFFISGAKIRAPAAARGLIARLGG
jgi:uncharacterized protein YecE (DUF72 family)